MTTSRRKEELDAELDAAIRARSDDDLEGARARFERILEQLSLPKDRYEQMN